MSTSWISRPTFVHGRSDQAVKRIMEVSEDGISNGLSMPGSKRSISYRLDGDLDDRNQHFNKRQHGESHDTTILNDMNLDKDDLRFKLMQKNMGKRSQNNDSWSNVDLRCKLSRMSRSSVHNKVMLPAEATVCRQYVVHEPMLEPKDNVVLAQIPSSRKTSDLVMFNSVRNHPSRNVDNMRQRSPERVLKPAASMGVSLDRSMEEWQRSLVRAYGDDRSNAYLRPSPSRPVRSSFLTRSSIPAAHASSIGALPAYYYQGSGIMQKIPSIGVEHFTVESLLQSLGLEKYTIYFKDEEIDMNAFKQLRDNDLKELGIPMGPRKKILQAIMSHLRRHP